MRDMKDYTRVTQALEFLAGFHFIPKDVLKNAAARGTAVHTLCTANILGLPQPDLMLLVNEYCKPGELEAELDKVVTQFNSYLLWTRDKKAFSIPDRFYSDQHMITGECDLIYQDGKDLVLVDFKTPAAESPTWNLQGSAYSYLAKIAELPIARIEFVKLSKTGKAPKVFIYEENFDEYLRVLHIYRKYFAGKPQADVLDYL